MFMLGVAVGYLSGWLSLAARAGKGRSRGDLEELGLVRLTSAHGLHGGSGTAALVGSGGARARERGEGAGLGAREEREGDDGELHVGRVVADVYRR